MSATGLEVFDKTLQTTNIWLNEIMDRIGPDRQVAWKVLSTVLHGLRDRLPVELVAHLGAQLPLLVRGVYYDRFEPARLPSRLPDARGIQGRGRRWAERRQAGRRGRGDRRRVRRARPPCLRRPARQGARRLAQGPEDGLGRRRGAACWPRPAPEPRPSCVSTRFLLRNAGTWKETKMSQEQHPQAEPDDPIDHRHQLISSRRGRGHCRSTTAPTSDSARSIR